MAVRASFRSGNCLCVGIKLGDKTAVKAVQHGTARIGGMRAGLDTLYTPTFRVLLTIGQLDDACHIPTFDKEKSMSRHPQAK